MIFSKYKEEHLEPKNKVKEWLKEDKMLSNLKKSTFLEEKIIYLFVVSMEALKI
jgi:hypothetical protein